MHAIIPIDPVEALARYGVFTPSEPKNGAAMAIESAGDLGDLGPPIDKVEFKYTLADGDVAAFRERLEHAQPSGRKVFFYDTEDLALKRLDLVLRFRTTEGEKDNSTVKLRPAGLADDGAAWRQLDDVEFEVDVVGAEHRISAKIDDKLKAGTGAPSDLASLFTADQRAFIEACAPAVDLDTVPMLGPIDARKWELDGLEGFPFTLDVEEWNVEDELIFLELSFKVGREAAQHAATAFAALLVRLGLDPEAPQQTKTDQVLRFFAARLCRLAVDTLERIVVTDALRGLRAGLAADHRPGRPVHRAHEQPGLTRDGPSVSG